MGQFHQHAYKQLLHAQFQKAQKAAWVDCLYCAFGICERKSFAWNAGEIDSRLPFQHPQLTVLIIFLFYFLHNFCTLFPSLTTGYKNCNALYTMGKQFSQRNLQFFVFFFVLRYPFIAKRQNCRLLKIQEREKEEREQEILLRPFNVFALTIKEIVSDYHK